MGTEPTPAAIPYDAIDVEIRRLVFLLNRFPGIQTVSSCAGHEDDEDTEVAFLVASQEALFALLTALPFVGQRGGIMLHRATLRAIWIDLWPHEDTFYYALHIAGSPRYVQRELLADVEASLQAARNLPPAAGWDCTLQSSRSRLG